MGGYPSRSGRIVGVYRRRKIRRNSTCRSRLPPNSAERSCRDVCLLTGAENEERKVRISDHELTVNPDERDEEAHEKSSRGATVSCQTSRTNANEKTHEFRLPLEIICATDARNVKDLLRRNPCKFNGGERAESGYCNEIRPHLHGYLDGIPIVLKLADTDEESQVRAFGNCGSELGKSNLLATPSPTSANAGTSGTKNTACDTGRRKTTRGSSVARQTSPMKRIRSANTSPCSFSKECLTPSYSFARSKCNRKNECVKKCATGSTDGVVAKKLEQKKPTSKAKSRNGNETKRSKPWSKPWITPPMPALKSEPLSDPSAAPAHIWYGNNAYAFYDDEPKPRATFNSENTTGKRAANKPERRKFRRMKSEPQNKIIAEASLTEGFVNSPFATKEIRSWNESVKNYAKEDIEAATTSGVVKPREYVTYSVLFNDNCNSNLIPVPGWLKNFTTDSRCSDVLNGSSKIGREIIGSRYSFLYEKNWNTFQPPTYYGNFNYFAVPVRVSKYYKNFQEKWKNSKRRMRNVTVDDEHNEQTLIIARTPAPRSNGTLLMGAKTVITVRENAFPRRYVDDCGVEEITPAMPEDKSWLRRRSKSKQRDKVKDDET